MKKSEFIIREILYQAIEKRNKVLTQAGLAKLLHVSLSTVNHMIKLLKNTGAVEVNPKNFYVVDIRKVLYHWASTRNLQKDVVYTTRVEKPVVEIEKLMPDTVVFGAYSAYKLLFEDVPADYSEVYIYGDESLKERFPQREGVPNLFVLNKDLHIERYGKTTSIANMFVDLWNLREWYAKEFVKAMEARLHGILE